ncbi:hypothetical protein AVEN_19941-1 [Araneus ventricosus]|uniref:Uncharacterized protein n=1 Tax=Araneus ventricosus TaxID=182803 RepID=A0A4Y2V702_ARAVE|nr:hypothetical protein AVEN_19941-1 [Araneus ventricosus]
MQLQFIEDHTEATFPVNIDTRESERKKSKPQTFRVRQRHHSICVSKLAFPDEMAFTRASSHNPQNGSRFQNHFNFRGDFSNPTPKKNRIVELSF